MRPAVCAAAPSRSLPGVTGPHSGRRWGDARILGGMSGEAKKKRRRRVVVEPTEPYDASYDSALLPSWARADGRQPDRFAPLSDDDAEELGVEPAAGPARGVGPSGRGSLSARPSSVRKKSARTAGHGHGTARTPGSLRGSEWGSAAGSSGSGFDEAFWREQMPPHWGRSE